MLCYICDQSLPEGQSYYEDHGQKVCLKCFQTTSRCKRCKFPSVNLEYIQDHGMVCEFCQKTLKADTGLECYLCEKKIWASMSHYADHGKTVCQECFKNADVRCFFCRFPATKEVVDGVGGVCEFCEGSLIQKSSNLDPLLQPLQAFLKQHQHENGTVPEIQWIDWRVLLGMQLEEPPKVSIRFFDEFVHFAYPAYFLKDKIYCIPKVPQKWFLPILAGQLATAELCAKYSLSHLKGNTPFHQLSRGWCHYIAYSTAKILKYAQVAKKLEHWPEGEQPGSFSKFLAMSEFRKPKEIITFAHQNIQDYAKKYL